MLDRLETDVFALEQIDRLRSDVDTTGSFRRQ